MEIEYIRRFGGKFNSYAHNFVAIWDSKRFMLERPFSSKQMTLNRRDAKTLRNELSKFLKGE